MKASGKHGFVYDSCVLIDYIKVDGSVLTLFARHVGRTYVITETLDEVEQLTATKARKLELEIHEPSLAQLKEAVDHPTGISRQDYLCLVVARDNEWTLVTNDIPLQSACSSAGVDFIRGLRPLLELLKRGAITKRRAISTAKHIVDENPRIAARVFEEFKRQAGKHGGRR